MNTYPNIDLKATGNRIKQLRKERNLRVQDISDYMGFMEPQAVYKWQRGESLPSVDNLFALSRLFDTPMENILMEHREADEASFCLNKIRKEMCKMNRQFLNCGFIFLCIVTSYNKHRTGRLQYYRKQNGQVSNK
jgi:transcriptional regulator with XRE-family HTH domain